MTEPTDRLSDEIGTSLAKLAKTLLEKAALPDADIDWALEVFKAATQYRVGTAKAKVDQNEPPKSGGMNGWKSSIASGSGAGTDRDTDSGGE